MEDTIAGVARSEVVVSYDRWKIRQLNLTTEKFVAIWAMMKKHSTLFSDLTRDDPANFYRVITERQTMWFEVWEHDVIVGLIWFADLWQVTDCNGHMVFFDRRPAEKVELCRLVVKWMFSKFPLHRISVTPPEFYHATVRLMEKIGLKREGRKRQSVLIGGRWNNQLIYGITRAEAEAL